MQKVTVKPHASVAQPMDSTHEDAALPDNVVIDSRGRRLVIGEPDFLTESRIIRALGEASLNTGYVMGYVMPAVRVVEIDGVHVPCPTNLNQVEAAIARLGREGAAAVIARDAIIMEKAKAEALLKGGNGLSAEAEALKNS
ncbi:hypothetical protein F4827_003089 [Paraburkholderia bannensis]|uniref:Uncharacterized protein n=1 Tax=Paraburkholderia bannensis TaxID=765414 RepID=A0A7W9TXN2_9BURK|nr:MULTISPECIES: hypothetical protein [Paraburkholderia]MBB3258221.1 hypothetical protein [Paraburkholderia sp. WP4_3_2]MBB6103234.1 hypothetical protein [Paraburkholderia bannensis]